MTIFSKYEHLTYKAIEFYLSLTLNLWFAEINQMFLADVTSAHRGTSSTDGY